MNDTPSFPRSLGNRAWYGSAKRFIHALATLIFHTKYTGTRNIPSDGPLVVVSNHQSHLDPPLMGCGSPRRLNYFARKSLFDSPVLGLLMSSVDAIPVDREVSPMSGIRETLRRLKRGEGVLMFPEGARCWDGNLGPLMSGFALLAKRSNAAVLPAAIEGAYHCWPRSRKAPRLGSVHVHFGQPIPAKRVVSMTEAALLAEAEAGIRQCQAILRSRPVFRNCNNGAID
jgi:1-acyl-sn-glycerol-3-phosphate acyltransferase